MARQFGAYGERQELESGKEQMRLDGEVAIRRLDPVQVPELMDRLREAHALRVPPDVFEDGVGEDQVVSAVPDAIGQIARIALVRAYPPGHRRYGF